MRQTDDSFYDESSETENSDEIGEESNTESDMSFDWSDSCNVGVYVILILKR